MDSRTWRREKSVLSEMRSGPGSLLKTAAGGGTAAFLHGKMGSLPNLRFKGAEGLAWENNELAS